MSTEDLKKPKLIMCKNCHQDILEEKMFLHEGFCIRNNVFCEKCERVFLKKDYDEHIKDIHNNNDKKNKKDSSSQKQKNPDKKTEIENKNSTKEYHENSNNVNENIEIKSTPSLEYVQMPVTELYHINNPIIISENGQIVSNKNKNEFLLPYLGINLYQNNKKSEEILDGIIKQGDIFKENNTFNKNSYKIEELQQILYKEKNNTYNRANTNVFRNYREIYANNTYDEQNLYYNYYNNYNKSKSFINNINYTDSNINDNNENTPINLNNNTKNKNVIINNSNKYVRKTHKFFPNKENQQKPPLINGSNNNSIVRRTLDPFNNNSIRSYHAQINKSFNNNFEKHFTGNKERNREPKDNNSRKSKLFQLSGQKKNPNKPSKPNTARGKNNMTKRCEFCNYIFNVGEINSHYKNCKNKVDKKKMVHKFDIPKPKKMDKLKSTEHINEFNEEKRIDEKKKESMNREFNAALNLITFNNEKIITKGMASNPGPKMRTKKLIKEPLKKSIKNKIFYLNEEKIEKDDFPEDTIKVGKTEIIQQTKNKLKRINNKSIDGNNSNDNFGKYIKIIKSPVLSTNISNEENEPWLYFYENNMRNKEHLGPSKEENNKKIVINRYEE